jgi:hypothetical protein
MFTFLTKLFFKSTKTDGIDRFQQLRERSAEPAENCEQFMHSRQALVKVRTWAAGMAQSPRDTSLFGASRKVQAPVLDQETIRRIYGR